MDGHAHARAKLGVLRESIETIQTFAKYSEWVPVEVVRREHMTPAGTRCSILDVHRGQHTMDVLMAATLTRVEALGLVGEQLCVVVKVAVELRKEVIEPRW